MIKTIIRYLKQNPGPGFNKMTEITTHIFMSDHENSNDIELLKSFGIRTILDVSNLMRDPDVSKQFSKKRIEYIVMNIPKNFDNIPLERFIENLNKAYEIIHNNISNNNKILVHCKDGVNMSSVFVIYYLLKRFYLTNFLINIERTKTMTDPDSYFLLDIIKFIKDRRLCIEPDASLIAQLLKVEDAIKEYYTKVLQISADQHKIDIIKSKLETEDKDDIDPYDDFAEPANIIDYLDEIYGKKEEPEKIEKIYDKLEDLFKLK